MELFTCTSVGNSQWTVYRGNIQDPRRKAEGAPEGTLPIHVDILQTGHYTMPDIFHIIGREDSGLARTIKESIYIKVNNPPLNRNIGKYNLHHIWDRVLLNTPNLKLTLPMGMCTEHTLVGMLNPFQPIGICIEPWGILGTLWIQSLCIEPDNP